MPKQAAVTKKAVRGSRTGRPIMALLDLLGRRWSLRIIWELRDGTLTSRALRTACDEASPTVVQARLTELREAGLVELMQGDGYRLTELGRELMRKLPALASLCRAVEQANSEVTFLFEHDLRANASRLSRGKTGEHFSGSCSMPPPPSGWRHRPARP